jgi:hypothetical protein
MARPIKDDMMNLSIGCATKWPRAPSAIGRTGRHSPRQPLVLTALASIPDDAPKKTDADD